MALSRTAKAPVEGRKVFRVVVLAVLFLQLTACGFFGGLTRSGGVQDSAPNVVLDNKKIKDAVPKVEPKSKGGNKSVYTVFGKRYRVMDSAKGFKERGDASWYGTKFHGRLTANGERYDMYKMTAAHKHLPLPTYVKVTNLSNGKEVIVRVNDRGPFHQGRVIDLSYAAASKLGILKKGTAPVEVEAIDPRTWAKSNSKSKAKPAAPIATVAKNKAVASSSLATAVQASSHSADRASNVDGKRRYLQVAAFQNLEAAQSAQNRLLDAMQTMPERINVVIHPTDQVNPLYRVRIGPLASTALDQKLRQTAQQNAFGQLLTVYE